MSSVQTGSHLAINPNHLPPAELQRVRRIVAAEAMKARDEYDRFVSRHADYNERYQQLFDEFRSIRSEATRYEMVEWLQGADHSGCPHWFVQKMTDLVNRLAFMTEEEKRWGIDRRSRQGFSYLQRVIDDSDPKNPYHIPDQAARTTIVMDTDAREKRGGGTDSR